ncbi:MAG: phytoene desaturase [Planctomycetales bacterium]|nr:phytoene desaturase [bacterium]UNM06990.1 MAG: phytoene desaturase [Planctomycetales bacterium]
MTNVIVIGGGLGGLSAATHLARMGCKVTLLEKNAGTGGRANLIEQDGFRFDTGPSLLNYPWVFEQLFADNGSDLHEQLELLEVEPGIRFHWPDGESLQLSSRFDRLRSEFERFDPSVGPRLSAWLERAGRNYRLSFDRLVTSNADNPLRWLGALRLNELLGLGLQRSVYGQLGTSFRSERIKQALGSYAMYLGGSPFDLPGLFEILPFGELNYGLWLPRGGIYALVEAMTRLAADNGVEIRTSCEVKRIRENGGRGRAVELADGSLLAADAIVSNVDVPTTDTLLAPEVISANGGGKRAARMAMTPGVLTFYWGLKRKVSGLGHHSIFFPQHYRESFNQLMQGHSISSEPPFYVSLASETDPSLAPEGKSTMFVLLPTPVLSRLGDVDWQAQRERLRQFVIARLRAEGSDISADDIEMERCYTPADWRDNFGLYDGSAFGASHRLLMLGPWRAQNYSRRLPGLYYTGASTTPGTGMPLVTLGGRMTAERVMQHAR